MNLFGIQIMFGWSPEARVFASLLGMRTDDINAHVLMHSKSGNSSDTQKFAATAKCAVKPYDTGWRQNTKARRNPIDTAILGARYYSRLPEIKKVAKEFAPDVIYSCQQHFDCNAATYTAQRLDKPQIIHLHYIIGPWLKAPVLKRLQTCEHVITVSDFIRDEALRHGVRPERVTTVRNTMALMPLLTADEARSVRVELGIPEAAFLFGIVSRLDAGKGHADTIAAFAPIAESAKDAWLVVVGSGAIENELKAQATATDVAGRIIFTGRRSDVPRLLGAMNVFVHPSRMDPCPLAILEALASGLPVIAYAEGGAKEMIVDGVTGYLTPPGKIDSLAQAMEALYRSPEKAVSMGAAARQRIATEFRPEDAGKKFSEIVRTVAG